ncbi:MAG: hypothetical protein QOE70_6865 [Chthoniobacter sp.]|jgi:hypothetical protein|nr:hypothetical protein [Chthoniobacter sp.]
MFSGGHFFKDQLQPSLAEPKLGHTDDARVRELELQVERLLLITEALWRLLQEKHGFDENELVRMITMIDLEDGKLDGRKPASPPKPCPKCQRILSKNRPRCLFCGEPIAADPFER